MLLMEVPAFAGMTGRFAEKMDEFAEMTGVFLSKIFMSDRLELE